MPPAPAAVGKNTKNVVADECSSSALNRGEVRLQSKRGSRHKYPEAMRFP